MKLVISARIDYVKVQLVKLTVAAYMVDVTVRADHDERLVRNLFHRAFQVAYADAAIYEQRLFLADEQIAVGKTEIGNHIGVGCDLFDGIIRASDFSFHNSSYLYALRLYVNNTPKSRLFQVAKYEYSKQSAHSFIREVTYGKQKRNRRAERRGT